MHRQDLVTLVKRIQSAEGSELEIDKMIEEFESNVPDPNATDDIFGKEYENLTAEEIVDKAMVYKSIKL
ncbi:MAG: hypothetical protein AAF502_22525 [Bacteroidota bacterium]